jgi:hypothetical protein
MRAELEWVRGGAAAAAEQEQAMRAELEWVRGGAAEHAARLDMEIARLADERDLRDRALAEANAALEHVHGSRSWRVTAPLRAGTALARAAAQRLRGH